MRCLVACVFAILVLSGLLILGRPIKLPDVWQGMPLVLNFTNYSTSVAQHSWASVSRVSTRAADLIAAAQASAPPILIQSVRDFLTGAVLAVSLGKTLSVAASGYVPDCIHTQEEAVRLYTTSKFWIALGGSCCELILIRFLLKEGYRNRRQNLLVRWFNSPLGWVFLVLLMAIPNGVLPISVLLVCACKLPDLVYVPAILISNFMKPYIVAAMRNSPRLGLTKDVCTTLHNLLIQHQPQEGSLSYIPTIAELILEGIVLFAVRFALAARNMPDEDDDLPISTAPLEKSPAKGFPTVQQKKKSRKS
ncbi:unnamed protein product [Phytomonas sp. EM1]|nr:unnamed protein product [Phytomonas sp. EM1]|eukprot:CCW63757.1 unnamed protein product [Phytomonas sp. isolate EM1]